MSLEVTLYHASTPTYPGGYSVDLGAYVRKGLFDGVVHDAEQMSVAEGTIAFDDPDFTLGHDSDGITGWQQVAVTESLAPTDHKRIFTGYTTNRTYSRGSGDRSSLITGVQNVCSCSVIDVNAFASFRNLRTTSHGSITANRPAETDVERIQWLLTVYYLSTTLFDGLVSTSNPVDMDAADYTDQKPADVITDCIQQSGKNAFVIYDEPGDYGTAGDFVLFYDFNDSGAYTTEARVSNDLADIEDETDPDALTLPPLMDARMDKSADRVYAGNFVPYGGGTAYAEEPDTADTFIWRDSTQPAGPKITNATLATARAARYSSDLSTEDVRISWSEDLPAQHVNRWLAGQRGMAKFTHLREFVDFTPVRVLRRTVRQTDTSGQRYIVEYEATPITPQPQGAYDFAIGTGETAIPVLPNATTPGNLLLLLTSAIGPTTVYPESPRFSDDPDLGAPPIAAIIGTGGWTIIETNHNDFGGMNIGGPCDGYFPNSDPCTKGIAVSISYRFVQPGEVTTHPVAVSYEDPHDIVGAWLWEIFTTEAPGSSSTLQAHLANPDTATLPTLTGNVFGAIGVINFDTGGEAMAATPINGTTVQLVQQDNDPTASTGSGGWQAPWMWIAQAIAGGSLSATLESLSPTYTSQNVAGVAVVLPDGVIIPEIPFPANQTG